MSLAVRSKKLTRLHKTAITELRSSQNIRLGLFIVLFVLLTIAAARPGSGIEAPAIALFVALFTYYVVKSRRLALFARRLEVLKEFYDRQSRRQSGLSVSRLWSHAAASNVAQKYHWLVNDLNLIGPNSLFSQIDESISDGGREKLVQLMLEPKLSATEIQTKQKQVQALSKMRWLFIRLIVASREEELELSTSQALTFLKMPLLEARTRKYVFGIIAFWAIAIVVTLWSIKTGSQLGAYFVVAYQLGSFFVFNQVGTVFKRGVGLSTHLGALLNLFSRIEKAPSIPELKAVVPTLIASRPSNAVRRFNFVLGFLSVEANPLIYLVVNALFPWTPFFTLMLERERKRMDKGFTKSIDEFHDLEVLASLSLLYTYQTKTFPTLNDSGRLDVSSVYHPMIPRQNVVANDFSFKGEQRLGLLTGSNMSGKSTFLRTVGVNQVLANMGAPVFADKFSTAPYELQTCIQVSDSLRDGFSYFYSEVLRLKALIEVVKSGTPTLYLIDEIFRGTNNRERQIGSRSVIQSLLIPTSVGFVSTHDLELTSLSETLNRVVNLHFKEEFRDNEMWFSYKLQDGPCPTTNALKIMEREGIDLVH